MGCQHRGQAAWGASDKTAGEKPVKQGDVGPVDRGMPWSVTGKFWGRVELPGDPDLGSH